VKLLQNPWVTGGLCLAALAVVYLQIFQDKSSRPTSGMPSSAAVSLGPVPTQKAAPASAEPVQPRNTEIAGTSIDRRYMQAHLSEWIDNPRRDPFLLETPFLDKDGNQTSSPVARWKLKAIWRQTGGRVAAINDRVYEEGDEIQGYKIERIEGDRVWFEGPHGKEPLSFSKPAPPRPAKPQPPPASPTESPKSSNPSVARS
jgi:hypothetical protein